MVTQIWRQKRVSSLDYLEYFNSVKQTTEQLNNLLCKEFDIECTSLKSAATAMCELLMNIKYAID